MHVWTVSPVGGMLWLLLRFIDDILLLGSVQWVAMVTIFMLGEILSCVFGGGFKKQHTSWSGVISYVYQCSYKMILVPLQED